MTSTNARMAELEKELAKLKAFTHGDTDTDIIADSAYRVAAEEADIPLTKSIKRTFADLDMNEYSRFRVAMGMDIMGLAKVQELDLMHDIGAYKPDYALGVHHAVPTGLKERGIGSKPCSHEHDDMKGCTHPFE